MTAQLYSPQSAQMNTAAGTRYFITARSRKVASSSFSRPVQMRNSQVNTTLMTILQHRTKMASNCPSRFQYSGCRPQIR